MAALRPVMAPPPVGRRAFAVFGVAGLALASMAVGLGLAFPGGIGSRAGTGAGVTPILVTPSRRVQPAVPVPQTPVVTSETARPAAAAIPTTPSATQATANKPAAPPATVPPDVLNQVNQTVSDVLGTLIPPQNGPAQTDQ
ncbi:MAG TPA: hypothetical protein VFA83_04500 [Acidimicrobiales bacterium]|nr:hypothetical protein [Acidimicrobiales bacterium]